MVIGKGKYNALEKMLASVPLRPPRYNFVIIN
jgi:hypothetical protein